MISPRVKAVAFFIYWAIATPITRSMPTQSMMGHALTAYFRRLRPQNN